MKARDLLEMDFSLLIAAILLTVFGVLFIYSSGITSTGVLVSTEYIRQIIWGIGGLVLAVTLALVNYRRIYDIAVYLYVGTLALLLYTCFFGRLVNGARAWLGIGVFGIQPSEFAKITTILFLARYLDGTRQGDFSRFVGACCIVFLPMGIILIQPDFGTALVFIPILLVMTFIAGISLRYVMFLGASIGLTSILMVLPLWQSYIRRGASSLPSLAIISGSAFVGSAVLALSLILGIALFGFLRYRKSYFYWIAYGAAIFIFALGASYVGHKVLKDYQIMRLIVFLNPNVDPRGSGWNIIQSITAIGSGGLMGKGYLQGTQSHYRFLPQQSTDFIFSIFTEEWGLLGGILVFALFLLICLRLARLIKTSADPFGAYIAAGLSATYSFHFLINVGMTMGIMPITGIPLLFMSYGGSALISAMAGIGLALSVYMRRYTH